ncbi:MAG TPA: NAD-dependent deacylase [Armatimonadota bacterium]|nr:NAD-dependent deacylase [Armatimonadota bacterium]
MGSSIEEFLTRLAEKPDQFHTISVLTGAGISAESGIPTFRGRDGLWRGMDPEELFTPEALYATPALIWQMYDELRTRIAQAAPNAGHFALAELARLCKVTLATQNIDGLHQRAGSHNVLELHGTLWTLRCTSCEYAVENTTTPLNHLPPTCPHCTSLLRPDIVLFSEPLPVDAYTQALQAAENCDLMLVIGTSGVVYPAAGLPRVARAHGAVVVEINPTETSLTAEVDYAVHDSAASALPRIVKTFRS